MTENKPSEPVLNSAWNAMWASIKFTKNDKKRKFTPKPKSHTIEGYKADKPLTKSKTNAGSKATFTIKPGEKPVRVWSLMWLEQVWQCMFIEYDNDIIIVDCWMEFSASETLWADYIVPDVRYLKQNMHKIRWIILSHGHLDHIGWLRDALPELNFPTIYTTPLTLWIVKKMFDNKQDVAKIKAKIIDPEVDILKLWCFTIEFVRVNHNIPETMAQAIYTPKWLIFNSSDFKFDHTPAIDKPADLAKIARIGVEWVKLYIGDSLWCSKQWWAPSEKIIGQTLDRIIKDNTSWRIIVATFASNVGRVIQLIQSAIKYNRVVFLSWRSMINNVEICQQLWYIQAPKWFLRKLNEDVEQMPDERVLILCTWAQGEEFSALARMSRDENQQITLRSNDTVLLSSSTIPGNELQMAWMMNALAMKWINLVTNNDMDIHASGHGYAEDHKLMLTLVNPEYFLPYYIEAYYRYEHRKLGLDQGIPDERILMPNENGMIIEMYDEWCKISEEKLDLDTVLIDGKGKGHLSWEYVVKARKIMAHDGVVCLVIKIDASTKELVGNIQIESRWFVYSSEVKKVHTDVVEFAKNKYNEKLKQKKDIKDIMKIIKDDLWDYVMKEVWRQPMIIPMYVYIARDWAFANGQSKEKVEAKVEQILEAQWWSE
jgi:ribonuclease J